MSDVFWQALIAGAVTVILAWMNQRTKNAVVDEAKKASDKTDKVSQVLEHTTSKMEKVTDRQEEKLDSIVKVTDATHSLCNSAMGEQKKLMAVTARAKANITNDPGDILVAETAEASLKEHDKGQAVVDSKQKTQL